MYADDMLLLNSSEQGLKRSLQILDDYCDKWQLVVNIKKTKIMIFNKIKTKSTFEYRGTELEIVHLHLSGVKYLLKWFIY